MIEKLRNWWCQYCESIVPPEHVTYEETHDPRAGGCGGCLHGGESAPTGQLVQRIIELDEDRKSLLSQRDALVENCERAIVEATKCLATIESVINAYDAGSFDDNVVDSLRWRLERFKEIIGPMVMTGAEKAG